MMPFPSHLSVVAHLPPGVDAAGLLGSVAADFGLQHLQTSVALVHMQVLL